MIKQESPLKFLAAIFISHTTDFVSQIRVSAVLTNAPYILNLDCDHYVNNSKAVREAMCFLMDPDVGRSVCYVQFPQRFDGIDKSDRYANRNVVFFDVSAYILQISVRDILDQYVFYDMDTMS